MWLFWCWQLLCLGPVRGPVDGRDCWLSCYQTLALLTPDRAMKVLKKIKARIGLSHKQTAYCPPAQPLEFHPVHGDNVMLSANNTVAAR